MYAVRIVNERPKSVQKAKAPSCSRLLAFGNAPLRRFGLTLFRRCPFGAFPGIFRLLDLSATLSPRMSGGTQNVSAEFTSKTRPKQEIRGCLLRPLGKTDSNWATSKTRTPVNEMARDGARFRCRRGRFCFGVSSWCRAKGSHRQVVAAHFEGAGTAPAWLSEVRVCTGLALHTSGISGSV